MGRRTAGLFALCLMAYTTLASTSWACAAAMATRAAPVTGSGHSTGSAGIPLHGHDGSPAPRRTPCPDPNGASGNSDCCGMLAPCGAVLNVARPLAISTAPALSSRIAMPAILTPTSLITAPDPPPPKA